MDGRSPLAAPLSSVAAPPPPPPPPHPGGAREWRLSLVVPAYNEEAAIGQAVFEACAALRGLTSTYEIVVVDDGSTDATADVVEQLAASRPEVRVLRHGSNQGYGAALRTGFAAARYERVAFTDADGQFDLADLADLLPLSHDYPVVVGYRQERQDPWRRRVLSRGYNVLTRLLLGTGVRDLDCAFKVFRRDVLPALSPSTPNYFANAEMLTRARQLGMAVAEVGVRHRPRLHGRSKVSLWEVPRTLATLLPFWWSQVMFPGSPQPRASAEGTAAPRANARGTTLIVLLLISLSSLLFFTRLRVPFLEPQESRYAEVARQMLQEGSYLVPVLNGRPFLDKPPLLYWLMMASFTGLGVHDWAARLVPGLVGVLTVLCTYLWGRRVAGPRAGLCGALVLCLSAGFIYRGRMLTPDGVLCLSVTAALASLHTALAGSSLRRTWWLLGAAACGLGLLSKGPLALLLIVPPVALFCWLEPRCPRVSLRAGLLFLGVASGLAAPWYVRLAFVPNFLAYFLLEQNVTRFVAPSVHVEPPWFYLPVLLLDLLPATLLLPGFLRFLARRGVRAAARRPPALGYFLLAGCWGLLFFSLCGSKRAAYLLPVLPPLALALGCYVEVLLGSARRSPGWLGPWRVPSRLAWQMTLLVLLLGLGVVALAAHRHMIKPGPAIALAVLALTGLSLFVSRSRVSWGVCTAVTFVALFAGVLQLLPAYHRQFALHGQVRTDAVLAEKKHVPIVCYPQRWDTVSFYAPGADVRVYTSSQRAELVADLQRQPRTLLLVRSGRALQDLLRELPSSLEFVVRPRPGPVTAGWVRRRIEPPCASFARR
jgi:4-amino-4-deoxy-L-arabinose transferase-like glycosyltransferase